MLEDQSKQIQMEAHEKKYEELEEILIPMKISDLQAGFNRNLVSGDVKYWFSFRLHFNQSRSEEFVINAVHPWYSVIYGYAVKKGWIKEHNLLCDLCKNG